MRFGSVVFSIRNSIIGVRSQTSDVLSRVDGSTLVLRIPMRFQRRGGRKRIVAPNGSEMVLTSRPQPDGTLKALGRAWQWQQVLEESKFGTVRDWPGRRKSTRPMSADCFA
jgi:hypothetical protein